MNAPMTPEEAVGYVEGLDVLGMKFGLRRMRALLRELGNPHLRESVHVVGSNGKTSTAHLAAALLASQGHRVGLYTSPDILGWQERIRVDGAPVPERVFAASVSAVREAVERLDLPSDDGVTQFEVLTAAAFVAFAEAGCDHQVLEAGLGGRYDATNVLPTDRTSVALTNISLEHTDLLGTTEAAIASEKLAVCPRGGTVVVGPMEPAALTGTRAAASDRRLVLESVGDDIVVEHTGDRLSVWTPRGTYDGLPQALRGAVQRGNLAVAIAVAERASGGVLTDQAAARSALADVRVPGRLELVDGAPPVLVDGAHNPAGMRALADALPEIAEQRAPVVAVISALGDKDVDAMAAALKLPVVEAIATRSSHARAIEADGLAERLSRAGLVTSHVHDPTAALDAARCRAGEGGLVVVCGSLYLLRDIYPLIMGMMGTGTADADGIFARAAHRPGADSDRAAL